MKNPFKERPPTLSEEALMIAGQADPILSALLLIEIHASQLKEEYDAKAKKAGAIVDQAIAARTRFGQLAEDLRRHARRHVRQ